MARATATVPTGSGSRYLQQLCKHWSHRFEVRFDATEGTIVLPGGACTLRASAVALEIALDGEAAALPRLGEVVAEHLRRFAFRETLDVDFVRN